MNYRVFGQSIEVYRSVQCFRSHQVASNCYGLQFEINFHDIMVVDLNHQAVVGIYEAHTFGMHAVGWY